MAQATVILDGLTLTEGPRWHEERLWFSDLYTHRVCSVQEDGCDLRTEATLEGVPSGLGWLPDGRLLVVQQAEQQVLRRESDGSLVVHADLSRHAKSWANDMAVAPDGTAYVGCWGFDLHGGAPFEPAPLMRVTPEGQVSVVGEPMCFPNGSVVVDGASLLVAESFANRISQFDIMPDGELANRRDWATFGPMPRSRDGKGRYDEFVVAADGISELDAEGAVWVADFTQRYASRVLWGGEIAETVSTGEHNCYAAALGGADGRTLFLCATRATEEEMDPELRARHPQSTIQSYRVEVPLR